jgi:hypothetical protein
MTEAKAVEILLTKDNVQDLASIRRALQNACVSKRTAGEERRMYSLQLVPGLSAEI